MGLLLGIWITRASTPERAGAQGLLGQGLPWFSWLRKMWVDGGYTGPDFAAWVRTQRPKLALEVVRRCDDVKGFKVLVGGAVGDVFTIRSSPVVETPPGQGRFSGQ